MMSLGLATLYVHQAESKEPSCVCVVASDRLLEKISHHVTLSHRGLALLDIHV
jgi:hypothetical protein